MDLTPSLLDITCSRGLRAINDASRKEREIERSLEDGLGGESLACAC